jgi:hypothetical protein
MRWAVHAAHTERLELLEQFNLKLDGERPFGRPRIGLILK